MKYYIIAGERSGDLHGSNLVKEIIARDIDAICKGFGGDANKPALLHLGNSKFNRIFDQWLQD